MVGLGPGGAVLVNRNARCDCAHPHRFIRRACIRRRLVGAATSFDDVYEEFDTLPTCTGDHRTLVAGRSD